MSEIKITHGDSIPMRRVGANVVYYPSLCSPDSLVVNPFAWPLLSPTQQRALMNRKPIACVFVTHKQFESMHRFLCDSPSESVDHKNGDGLDNRRENLRNMIRKDTRSGFKGVSFHKQSDRWRSYIVVNAKQIHLGYFANACDAAVAYDTAAKRLFGEFASLNNLPKEDCDAN